VCMRVFVDRIFHDAVTAPLDSHGVCAGGDVLRAFAIDRPRQDRGRGRAIAGDVRGLTLSPSALPCFRLEVRCTKTADLSIVGQMSNSHVYPIAHGIQGEADGGAFPGATQ
jgi:hypothetical protein